MSDLPSQPASRLHTARGRLASFVGYPGSGSFSPIELSEAGLVNTQDYAVSLRHFLEYGTPIEEDIFGPSQHGEGWLKTALADVFPNNMMLKGFASINVPLHRTHNCFPAVAHTVADQNEPGGCIETDFTHVCSSENSEFFISANADDGSVCIWNAALQLFVAGRLNLKQTCRSSCGPASQGKPCRHNCSASLLQQPAASASSQTDALTQSALTLPYQ